MHILAGDIGGTNTRLLFAQSSTDGYRVIAESNYPSNQYHSLLEVIEVFFSEHDIEPVIDTACFAVAGPVLSGLVSVTNLPWVISEQELRDELGIARVRLINDFVAVAYGIAELEETDIEILQHGQTRDGQPLNMDAAVIGAGTGLGVSHLVYREGTYHPYPSEAGHVGFAPENQLQCELLAWLLQKHPHVSVEMLLSGNGMGTLYYFLQQVKGLAESTDVRTAMQQMDPAQVISEYALSAKDELCSQALDLFIDIYGSVAGNVALHYYPVGTLYIAGGIAAKISKKMMDHRFIDAFQNKGAISSILRSLSVKLVTMEKVGLYGAVNRARHLSD